jgi:hypothetical protein
LSGWKIPVGNFRDVAEIGYGGFDGGNVRGGSTGRECPEETGFRVAAVDAMGSCVECGV